MVITMTLDMALFTLIVMVMSITIIVLIRWIVIRWTAPDTQYVSIETKYKVWHVVTCVIGLLSIGVGLITNTSLLVEIGVLAFLISIATIYFVAGSRWRQH